MEKGLADNKLNRCNEEGLLTYIIQHKLSVLLVWIFAVLIYGVWCAQNIVTFDAEGFFDLEDGQRWYRQWFELGRWSMVLFKYIINNRLINPFFQIALFGLFFPASVIFWWFCFYRWNRNQESRFGLLLFSGIYLSHPIWATQFAYRNQMESITFLMCLLPIALLLITDHAPEGRIPRVVISAMLTVICFGGYQSFMFMYGEGVILYLLFRLYHDYTPETCKTFWKEILFLGGFTVVCFAGDHIISWILCARNGLTYGTDYLNSQFHWGSYPAADNLQVIVEYLYNSLISNGTLYNCLGIIEIVAGAVLICFVFRDRPFERILGVLLFIASWLTPFLLLFVTASPIVHRSQFSYVLALAFWGAIELGVLIRILSGNRLTEVRVIMIALICAFTIVPQMQKNTRLLYTDYMTMHTDEVQLWTIYYQALEKGAHEGDPIVFLSGKDSYMNGSMVEQEVIGFSYFEFNRAYGEDMDNARKIIEAMRACGMNVSVPTEEQRAYASLVAEDMDVWPRAGGIAVQNGIIIVKL